MERARITLMSMHGMFDPVKMFILNVWKAFKVMSRVVAEIPPSTSESVTSYHMLNICLTAKRGSNAENEWNRRGGGVLLSLERLL